MEKYSVKRPFTVLVAVIIMIALGGVSLTHLSMDLLPEISLPYLIVITAYPGASPEKVEELVTKPLENELGTINGVENITSTSSENYSVVQMEFEDDTDMNTAMVRVSSAINQIESSLPEGTATPNILEISLDMIATMYVAVEKEDCDIYELTDFVNYNVIPQISRQPGVASVTTMGLVERSIQVVLNDSKIDDLNDRILRETDEALQDAADQLDDATEQLTRAQEELDRQQAAFGSTLSNALFSQINAQAPGIASELRSTITDLTGRLGEMSDALDTLQAAQNEAISAAQSRVEETQNSLDEALATQLLAQDTLNEATQLYNELSSSLASVTDTESEEYASLSQQVNEAYEAMVQAQAGLDISTLDAGQAQALYDQAAAALQEALDNSGLYDPENAAELRSDIADLRSRLNEASGNINGASITDLITTTTQLQSLAGQTAALLSRIREADPAGSLNSQVENASSQVSSLTSTVDSIPALLSGLQSATAGLTQGQLDAAVGFSEASVMLSTAQAQLDSARTQYEQARDEALENANADALLTPETLSSLIYAQNFSMPIGYIDDENDNSWLLRVGEEFSSPEEVASMLLLDNDIIGTVTLEDIADVIVIDNADESYTKLNGNDAVILCIYKGSTAGTNDVSRACNEAFEELMEQYPGMEAVNLVDQGDYINMIVGSVFQSMIIGALLAVVILALFLKDVKPTIVVAVSIPLSVLLAIVLMYFTGLDLNMMTLSGLSLGIGMLVDNSVVVMENIFRLRNKGVSAARAAVQGAKQVRGAIVASTLTTICVFFPAVFASGMVRSLLYPLALSIGYCLVASLGISLSVVPASCSTLMKKSTPKKHPFFAKILKGYGNSLRWCLRFKIVPLAVAVLLLAFSVYMVFQTGIVYIPEIVTNEITVEFSTPEGMTREESYAAADEIMDTILSIDGVEGIGIMDRQSTSSFLGISVSNGSYGRYTCNAVAREGASAEEVHRIVDAINEATADSVCDVEASSNSGMDMSALSGGSGMSVYVYGNDFDTLESICGDIGDIISGTEGFTNVRDSFDGGDDTLVLIIDRDAAMSHGLTVAQIFAGIASRTSVTVNSTTITVNGIEMKISVVDDRDTLTRENLMDTEFEPVDMTGGSGSMAGSSSSFSMSSLEELTGSEDTEEADDVTPTPTPAEEEQPDTVLLSDIATLVETTTSDSIARENLTRYATVSADTLEGYNTTLLARDLEPLIDEYAATLPNGYTIEVGGEYSQVLDMVDQMLQMACLALLFIYVIMVAQFQSLLSPFIILFTIPLAFTGGMLGLVIAGEQLSMLSLLGFVVLMGTVVNNGIVFVDYCNQLRTGGLERREALVATGVTRMRPILMTALTTILAMSMMVVGSGMASQLGKGMAIVISGGLLYATFMTLYIVPVMYDILFKKQPLAVDIGDDTDIELDDAADYLLESLPKQ